MAFTMKFILFFFATGFSFTSLFGQNAEDRITDPLGFRLPGNLLNLEE